MAELITHRSNEATSYCRLKLASGERVLISIGRDPEPSVQVIRLGFFGLIPLSTLWEYDPTQGEAPLEFLDRVCDCLVECASIHEARLALAEREAWGPLREPLAS